MIHDVLRTDIDLATKLRDDHRPDDEIILALVHRGVDPGQAAQLLDDLRKGIKPTPQSPVPAEMSLVRRSRSRSVPPENEPARPSRPSRARARNGSPAQSADSGRKSTTVFWLIVAIFAGLVLTAGTVILIQRHKNVPPPSLVLELQPDGLHLGGGLVTGGNVLTAVANLLGVPTRTNQVGRTDTTVYAYDRQGLLIYSQKSGGTNSIVLDCEAIGGPNGTTSPFTGSLKVEDRMIGPGTDSQTLAAIKKLELNHPGTGGNVWSGHYNGLDLVFAYLKSPQRLSLIEIDLK